MIFRTVMDPALGDHGSNTNTRPGCDLTAGSSPFQNNLAPADNDLLACLEGLLEVQGTDDACKPETFRDWLLQSFGKGLCDTFMFPYNFKVWAYAPDRMDTGWMGERVARVDLARILQNMVRRTDDVGWGPNATFRFPQQGGTGAIWKSVFGQLPGGRIRLGARVSRVNPQDREITLQDGETVRYDRLISTMPADRLLMMLQDVPESICPLRRPVRAFLLAYYRDRYPGAGPGRTGDKVLDVLPGRQFTVLPGDRVQQLFTTCPVRVSNGR